MVIGSFYKKLLSEQFFIAFAEKYLGKIFSFLVSCSVLGSGELTTKSTLKELMV